MVSVDNEGQHGLYIDGPSTCLEGIGDRFLFTGSPTLPTRDTRCTTSPLPYDRKVYPLSGPVSGAKSERQEDDQGQELDGQGGPGGRRQAGPELS